MNTTLTSRIFFENSRAACSRRVRLSFASSLPLLLLLTLAATAQPARAQMQQPPPSQQKATATIQPASPDESESEDETQARPRLTDPAAILRSAHAVFVRSKTVFVNESEVEDSLRKRKEFRAWGLTLTRNDTEADLVIEIERKALTRRFTFSVIDPRTMLVVSSGKTRSVLFGKKIPNKVAEKFVNRMKAVRPFPAPSSNP